MKNGGDKMKMARLYFKDGHTCWTWHKLMNGRVVVNKDFYDKQGFYRADASYKEEMSWENLLNSLEMAKQLLSKVSIF